MRRAIAPAGRLASVGGIGVVTASCGGSGAAVASSGTVSASFTPIREPCTEQCVRLLSPGSGAASVRDRCAMVAGRPWFHAVVTNPFGYEIALDCGLVAHSSGRAVTGVVRPG